MAKKKGKTVRITLIKSPIGNSQRHKNTVRALGLRRINQSVEYKDGPVLWGMLYKIGHMVRVEESK